VRQLELLAGGSYYRHNGVSYESGFTGALGLTLIIPVVLILVVLMASSVGRRVLSSENEQKPVLEEVNQQAARKITIEEVASNEFYVIYHSSVSEKF
jgi:uncharacterized membrane protein